MAKQASKRKKVLAVASLGGHWVQLLRICHALSDAYDIEYVCTDGGAAAMTGGAPLHVVRDFSRWDAYRLPGEFMTLRRIIRRVHPDAVITTGAAPGLVAVAVARLEGIRTLWIDSIANSAALSGSGRIAARIADSTFTQWPALATDKVKYYGNIFGEIRGREELK